MAFYGEMQNLASEILAEFKQGVIRYIKITPGNGPADNPGPSTQTPYALDAVAKGVSFKYVKDGLALSTDLTVVAAVRSDITPNMRDFIEVNGVNYKIVQDISSPASDVRVVWKFIVRKG